MTIERLTELFNYWKNRLALNDWNIRLKYVRHYEMPDHTSLGYCEPWPDRLLANIYVLQEQDIDPDELSHLSDVEITLVHELLHVWVAKGNLKKRGVIEIERMVESLSQTLVKMRREIEGIK